MTCTCQYMFKTFSISRLTVLSVVLQGSGPSNDGLIEVLPNIILLRSSYSFYLDIAEQVGGPIENDIYGPSHRFGSRTNVSRVVQGNDEYCLL